MLGFRALLSIAITMDGLAGRPKADRKSLIMHGRDAILRSAAQCSSSAERAPPTQSPLSAHAGRLCQPEARGEARRGEHVRRLGTPEGVAGGGQEAVSARNRTSPHESQLKPVTDAHRVLVGKVQGASREDLGIVIGPHAANVPPIDVPRSFGKPP